ncbi:(Fe-S)-binding protein [Flavihumibacter stibioxidans]|uniref:Fe-S oxidoreductase n=1 Tax=Flavihumibacter stibioxidans TaxID=1834163 RepID=A0ABR7M9S5_9BACT|nr:(Fe-S)-binding protein [Flavihumibacter stibioxidans]MBC6491793.1 Fe-S oxidoreductase [Flavihumibacter stibioxidans]
MLTVGLFVPCYIDQFFPQVAIASLQLLEKLGCRVVVPTNQTCCGQPMANSGFAALAAGCDKNFIRNFAGLDFIVSPSGSCVLHVKEHLSDQHAPTEAARIRNQVYELTEFLTDILKVQALTASFPYKVGWHNSCHGQRGLHLSSMSELVAPDFSKPARLLQMVDGLELILPQRVDECCGFGGTFSVYEEAVSVKMGRDRIREHEANEVDCISGVDMSCLMHLQGILNRQGSRVRILHIAEILNARS